jgi:hypothetical protein
MGRGSVQVARTLARIEKSSAVALSEDPGGKNKWDDPNPTGAASISAERSLSQSSWQPDATLVRFPRKPVNAY